VPVRWSQRQALRWVLAAVVMTGVTALMIEYRGAFDQVHVVLVYLLIVLFASASSGRPLGITVACVGFVLIDYYFQPPYGEVSVGKPLDWLALLAFLITALVSTNLLARARSEAEEARRRTIEVESLARLGSETLSAGRAEDAPARIAEIIKSALGMSECSITATTEGVTPLWSTTPDGKVRELVIPLAVQQRVVGALRLANAAPVALDPAHKRFLDAIAYYAALAIDRVRLVAEAERAEALREADRLKDIVLASVSHDLRTPLTTIKALAQSEALQGSEGAAAIEEQADRLTRLVSDLLDLSRLKSGGFSATPELNTAEDLIGAAVRQTRGLFNGQPVHAVIDLNSPALVGFFDFAQSLRVLSNFLENAARYSPPSEAVELAARRDGAALVFSVSDRGPGVSEPDRARIFEPFYRSAGSAPDAAARAGLGLSIARTLAQIQGGSVAYRPRSGGGAVFELRLPASELRADALEPDEQQVSQPVY
jgi:two-component system sensor histidine kinase KdpD